MPDIVYDTQDAVPEDVRSDAVAKDGKFVVSLVAKSKLDEFRNNNINVVKERDGALGILTRLATDTGLKYEKPEDLEGFVTAFKDMQTTAQLVADGKLIKDTSLDEALGKRTSEMQKQHQAQVTGLQTLNQNLTTQVEQLQTALNNTTIDQAVTNAVMDPKSGVRPDALKAVIREARDFFKVKDGKLVALDGEGTVIYGSDGVTPMTPAEWIKNRLVKDSPYLFLASEGGGAGGGAGGMGNYTAAQLAAMPPQERMRIARENAKR